MQVIGKRFGDTRQVDAGASQPGRLARSGNSGYLRVALHGWQNGCQRAATSVDAEIQVRSVHDGGLHRWRRSWRACAGDARWGTFAHEPVAHNRARRARAAGGVAARVWWLRPAPPPPVPPPQPARRAPPQLQAPAIPASASVLPPAESAWLEYELRHLLNRGRMRVAAIDDVATAFTLRVTLNADMSAATRSSRRRPTPSRAQNKSSCCVERQLRLRPSSRMFAQMLPQFLAAQAGRNWVTLIGTEDERLRRLPEHGAAQAARPEWPGPHAGAAQNARLVDRLEALARLQPHAVPRALGAAPASLTRESRRQGSVLLTQLAKSSAERTVAADDEIAEAHAALGLVHMRQGDWTAAREQFDRAPTSSTR